MGRSSFGNGTWAGSRGAALVGLLASVVVLATGLAAAGPAFAEVATAEGIAFWRAGDRLDEDPNFVEMMGGGACWLDLDNDGDQDVFLVNGWYNDTALAQRYQPRSQLFRNDGPGPGADFVDATDAAGLDVRGWTQGCSAADYDGDGWVDLFVLGHGIHRLLRNVEGRFVDVSASVNITAEGKCPDNPCWSTSAAWGDYDRDGCLDLYVVNFVSYNVTDGGARGPGLHTGHPNQLYRSRCDGTGFDEVGLAAGADGQPGPQHSKNWGVSWFDYNRDGWLDIYVASDGVPNILYRNNQNGTFTDVAEEAGVADPRNGMGLAINDCNDDGWEDLFFTHYSGIPENAWWGYDGFYTADGDLTYTDRSGEGDLAVTLPYVKWGVGWEDFDDDGALDLHVVTGATDNVPDAEQPHLLWRGDAACTYTDVRAGGGRAIREERNSRGSSYADWDLDGDLDGIVVNVMDQDVELLENRGASGRSLTVELRQPGLNPRALGAKLEVELPGGRVLHRRLMPFQSIHGNHQDAVHLGLGEADRVNITVVWPGDQVAERFEGLDAGGVARLHRGGRVQRDVLAPVSTLHLDGPAGAPGWQRGPTTVRVAAEDRGAAGVAAVALLLDGAPADPAGTPLPPGVHVLRFRGVDLEGNAEPWREAIVGRDDAAPASRATLEGTVAPDGWYEGPVQVTLACSDDGSGPGGLAWRLDAEPWAAYPGPFALARPGSHRLAWRCTDLAGNVEEERSVDLALDLGRPATHLRLDGVRGLAGWWRSAVVVTVVPEGGREAIAVAEVAVGDAPFAPAPGAVVLADGIHRLRVRSVDAAGREEPVQEVEVRVDATPPALGARDLGPHVALPDGLLIGPLNRVRAAITETGSGVAVVERRPDQGTWRSGAPGFHYRVEGDHTLGVRARDVAGNSAEATVPLVLDLTPPRVSIVAPRPQAIHVADALVLPWSHNPTAARAILLGPVTLEAEAADSLAGMAHVRFVVEESVAAEVPAAPWRWTWDLPPGDGYHRLRYLGTDRVGNAAAVEFEVVATGDPAAMLPAPLAAAPGLVIALAGLVPWRIRPRR